MIYKAVILVGGPSRGTRFRPLSLNVPKPLFPIAGHPIIWHHLDALSKVEGLKEVLLIGFYEDSVFQRFIDDAARDFPQIYVRYLREYQSLGTAGGLYHFRDEIQKNDPRQIFVLNADVACSFPLNDMVKFHNTHRGLCTILGTKVAREVANRFGCLVEKSENHEVLHYVEKPESFISNLISCGIYLFDCAIFGEMKKAMQNKTNRVDQDQFQVEDDKLRLEQDILRPLAESSKLFVYETTDAWIQIKTPSSAVPANALFLEQYQKTNPDRLLKNVSGGPTVVGLVYKHPSASVDPSAKIGPNVTIGPRAVIGKGVRIKDSIILDNAEIKNNGCVLYSIIGWDSKIGNWSRVEGTPTTDHSTTVTQNGVKIQSISILAKEVTVKDEIIIRNCIVLPNKELKTSCHNEVLM
ncbi:nucleotide-diphospho-sugar transferase [Gigaspora rosea]|uniref:mannose-1-phosphate guanylyltransferase n=1 Tax=Gigaspora rosea TaxID=44941 RepID=A0A397UYT5_9GLOM|nr:nucleotide-diphospho-sugar transferase [Gigaspora rosea]